MKLEVLKRSRKPPQPGDIFVYRVKGFDYGFGRVIRTNARMKPCRGLLVLYFYDAFAKDKDAVPKLDKRKLLFPPTLLFPQCLWTKGLLETVRREKLQPKDVLRVHCFWSEVHSQYVDEYGRKLRRKSRPCGWSAIGNEYAVEVDVCKALGTKHDP